MYTVLFIGGILDGETFERGVEPPSEIHYPFSGNGNSIIGFDAPCDNGKEITLLYKRIGDTYNYAYIGIE